MLKLIILVFLGLVTLSAYSQQKESLSVNAMVVGKGKPFPYDNPDSSYIVRLVLTNNEDTTLPITIWTCSWFWNWKLSTNSIGIQSWGCDSNYPDTISIHSKQSLVFYLGLFTRTSMTENNFKIGFANWRKGFSTKTDMVTSTKPEGVLYWSNIVSLKKIYAIGDNYACSITMGYWDREDLNCR